MHAHELLHAWLLLKRQKRLGCVLLLDGLPLSTKLCYQLVRAALLRQRWEARWRAIIACCQQQRQSAPVEASLILWAPPLSASNGVSKFGADSGHKWRLRAPGNVFWNVM